jgi:hypothetical protein
MKEEASENNSSFGSLSVLGKKMYKIDRDGYLMDSENKYILSPNNAMIKIPQNKIT